QCQRCHRHEALHGSPPNGTTSSPVIITTAREDFAREIDCLLCSPCSVFGTLPQPGSAGILGSGEPSRPAELFPPEKGPPMMLRSPLSRRRFVQALAASPFLAPMRAAETPRFGGSRLGLGIIGMGTRAR